MGETGLVHCSRTPRTSVQQFIVNANKCNALEENWSASALKKMWGDYMNWNLKYTACTHHDCCLDNWCLLDKYTAKFPTSPVWRRQLYGISLSCHPFYFALVLCCTALNLSRPLSFDNSYRREVYIKLRYLHLNGIKECGLDWDK